MQWVEVKNGESLCVFFPLIWFFVFPCKVWCFSSSLVTSILGQTFSLDTILFFVCPCPCMSLPVCWLLTVSLFSLGYPNLHPSSTQLCHSFPSFPHCRLGAGFTSVLQMLGTGEQGEREQGCVFYNEFGWWKSLWCWFANSASQQWDWSRNCIVCHVVSFLLTVTGCILQ